MFCQICGARIPEGRSSCVQCGAPAGGRALSTASSSYSLSIRSCPRCGYQGQSGAYFSTTPHLLGLIGSAVVFAPAAFIYFVLRYNYRVCPSCGESWGKHGMMALPSGGAGKPALADVPGDVASMGEGGGKRVFSWMLFTLAAFFTVMGIATEAPPALMFAVLFAGAGFLLRRSGNEDRIRRRDAILQSLQRPVLQLAAKRKGTLTVTEVAAEFGWSIPRSEKVLQSLEDGYRVMGDVTSEGVIVYNFLELVPAPGNALPAPRQERAMPLEQPAEGAGFDPNVR
jgi:hypothetical protein